MLGDLLDWGLGGFERLRLSAAFNVILEILDFKVLLLLFVIGVSAS